MKPTVWTLHSDVVSNRLTSDRPEPDLLILLRPVGLKRGGLSPDGLSPDERLRHLRSAVGENDDAIDFEEFDDNFDDEDEHADDQDVSDDNDQVDDDDVDEIDDSGFDDFEDEDSNDFDDNFTDGDDGLEEPFYDLGSSVADGTSGEVTSRNTTGLRNQSLSSS